MVVEREVAEWMELIEDPLRFTRRLWIEDLHNQAREVVNFLPEQRPWMEALCDQSRQRKLCVKPRQGGITTGSQLYLFWKLFTSSRARRAIQHVHEESAIRRLCRMVRVMHEHLPDAVRRRLKVDNIEDTEFLHNNAAFGRTLAGGTGGQVRGWTATDLHATEMAKWKGATSAVAGEQGLAADEEAFNSTINAMHDPTGSIIVESTGNGPRGLFYRLHKQALTDPHWHHVFISWLDIQRYQEPLTATAMRDLERELDPEEQELVRHHGVSLQHIAFRRKRIRTDLMSPLMFQREFPLTFHDPFILYARGWFDPLMLRRMAALVPARGSVAPDGELVQFLPYDPKRRYVMGVDTSGGVGADEASVCVLRDDYAHAAQWGSRWTSPREQARWVSKIGGMYGAPLTLIERNRDGVTVIPEVERLGGCTLWLDDDGEPFWSDRETKREVMTHAREQVDSGFTAFRDPLMIAQLANIVEKPNGKIEARGKQDENTPLEEHDDRAMSGCLALFAGRRVFRRDILALDTERERIARIRRLGGTDGAR